MSARIQITGGASHAAEYHIHSDIVRVGSDPASDVVVPEAPWRWFTLQYRDGKYYIYNRANNPLRLGDRSHPPGAPPTVWPAREALAFNNVALHLYCDDNQAPDARTAPLPVYNEEIGIDELLGESDDEDSEPGVTGKQLSIIVGCGLLILLMMVDALSSSTAKQEKQFDWLVNQYVDNANSDDEHVKLLLESLQEGRYYENRADFEAAKRRYGEVRDAVLSRQAAGENMEASPDRYIFEYIMERLQRVESRTPSEMFPSG